MPKSNPACSFVTFTRLNLIMEDNNELINETSPYLLQHAHNPVHWKAWNERTLALAKKENKPLLISIGYAACHWCHVMEKESFEDGTVAALMNKNFICIKVDREERPDVDQVYMSVAQMINGNGGWPLNAFALPDGRPFFAGTYFPKKRWMELLAYFARQYNENFDALKQQAEHLSNGVRESNFVFSSKEESEFQKRDLEQAKENLESQFDPRDGGLASSIKFPMPSVWELVLELYHKDRSQTLIQQLELTLNQMANGGIYDQLGGGFARYATDRLWKVPHFEKMLYDNAQLISLYCNAYQLTGNYIYRKVAEETIDFILGELSSGKGFYTSLDADSGGMEGAFYLWTYDEIEKILEEDTLYFTEAFGVTPGGNFEEGKNILHRIHTASWHDKKLDECRRKLLQAREKRVGPSKDDKVITAWNALLSIAFTDAARAFQNRDYLNRSKEILDFIISDLLINEKELYRNFQKGSPATHAFLDDYAFLIKSLVAYYQATFDIKYLDKAKELTSYVLQHFFDSKSHTLFYSNELHPGVFSRPVEITDNVIPSSSAVMAENLFVLGSLYSIDNWVKCSVQMVKNLKKSMISEPSYFSYWLRLFIKLVRTSFEIAIVGKNAQEMLHQMQNHYLPDCIFCGDISEQNLPLLDQKYKFGQTLIYVCTDKSCQSPVDTVAQALLQMEKIRQ